ncbi:hypothetical protein F441_20618 [Phytophthora nicotianae CJ01A1]|uniref:RxLR effector protein n=5 Tax=Phytophthora nicotianae TaxID=4792 RepID=W2QXE6_PHYN3|nr:hypothetical protein PPTG_21806 [Phytophthora nicotianae INRA-310]ETI32455.1 hypothetical protein F443_20746 [Phytophthora nicotianae P1569]ETK72827.1 hypothetical protein L915_20167 [Phytophthora nicotianae]ETP02293.1 hypothetical protein F441_20618 [Phytophthora nicotianae CJ01A1]ETP30477.1 hypothetical protein F442_20545 [Phytophthora nicotianae P10297]ETL26280.1 hypothetical protein L916_20034 [Phytophthora nicotianae]
MKPIALLLLVLSIAAAGLPSAHGVVVAAQAHLRHLDDQQPEQLEQPIVQPSMSHDTSVSSANMRGGTITAINTDAMDDNTDILIVRCIRGSLNWPSCCVRGSPFWPACRFHRCFPGVPDWPRCTRFRK